MTQLGGSPFQPSQLFVSHVNGSPSFVRKCRKSWLSQGSLGSRVTLLPGTTFLHINGTLHVQYTVSMNNYTYFNDMHVSIKRRTAIEVQKSSGQSCEKCQGYHLDEQKVIYNVKLQNRCPNQTVRALDFQCRGPGLYKVPL